MGKVYTEALKKAEENILFINKSFIDVGAVGMLGGVIYAVYGEYSVDKGVLFDGLNFYKVSLGMTLAGLSFKGLHFFGKKAWQKMSELEKKLDSDKKE